QNWKLSSDKTGLVASPINLRKTESITVFRVIPRNGSDVALPPAPLVNERCSNVRAAHCDGSGAYDPHQDCASAHRSRLDKATLRSQSSTVSGGLNRISVTKTIIAFLAAAAAELCFSHELPSLVNVVEFSKLLPLLPEAPTGWTADKPQGSTTDAGGFKLTNVHRDYRKGGG